MSDPVDALLKAEQERIEYAGREAARTACADCEELRSQLSAALAAAQEAA